MRASSRYTSLLRGALARYTSQKKKCIPLWNKGGGNLGGKEPQRRKRDGWARLSHMYRNGASAFTWEYRKQLWGCAMCRPQ